MTLSIHIFKEKGNTLWVNSLREVNLLELTFNLYKKQFRWIAELVDIEVLQRQCGFMPEKGAFDSVFVPGYL